MASKRHTHKYYYGLEVAGTKVWACALPDCQHFMPKHMENLVNGRRAVCWECNGPTIVDFSRLKSKEYDGGKVFCDDCIEEANLVKSGVIKSSIKELEKTDDERRAELIRPVAEALEAVKCRKCKINTAMISANHGLCGSCFLAS